MAMATLRPKPKARAEDFYESWLPMKRTLSVADVASGLDIDPKTVRAWIDEGKFLVMDVSAGSKPNWRIERNSLLKYLKERVS